MLAVTTLILFCVLLFYDLLPRFAKSGNNGKWLSAALYLCCFGTLMFISFGGKLSLYDTFRGMGG